MASTEAQKRASKKWRSNEVTRMKYNAYMRELETRLYKTDPIFRMRKINNTRFRVISAVFRNILIDQ